MPCSQRSPQELIGGGADAIGWYSPANATFHLRTEGGSRLSPVALGRPGDVPLTGDWNGDGRDTLGVYRRADATFHLRDERGTNLPVITFGSAGADVVPLAADWNGDGRDTLALYRRADASFVLRDDTGRALPAIRFGVAGADVVPLTGDWDGDGRDSLALFRGDDATFFLLDDRDANVPHRAARGIRRVGPSVTAAPGDRPLVGDWDGDGRDAVGVYRPSGSTYHLRGFTDRPRPGRDPGAVAVERRGTEGPIVYGTPNVAGAVALTGDWNGRDLVTLEDLVAIFGARADSASSPPTCRSSTPRWSGRARSHRRARPRSSPPSTTRAASDPTRCRPAPHRTEGAGSSSSPADPTTSPRVPPRHRPRERS